MLTSWGLDAETANSQKQEHPEVTGAGWPQWGPLLLLADGLLRDPLRAPPAAPEQASTSSAQSCRMPPPATQRERSWLPSSPGRGNPFPFRLGPPVRRGAKGRSVHVCLCLGTKNRLVTKLASPWGPSSPILFLGPVSQRKGPCPRGLAGGN